MCAPMLTFMWFAMVPVLPPQMLASQEQMAASQEKLRQAHDDTMASTESLKNAIEKAARLKRLSQHHIVEYGKARLDVKAKEELAKESHAKYTATMEEHKKLTEPHKPKHWSEEEDRVLMDKVNEAVAEGKYGVPWREIVKWLPGRSAGSVRNHYQVLVKNLPRSTSIA